MKKSVITIFALFLMFLIFFILVKDEEQELGDNYYYLPKYEAIDIGYPGGAIIYRSPQRLLFKDIKIHREVISVNHNKDFIIAIQKTNIPNVEKIDSGIVKKDSLQYFIIVKKSDHVYGPYNKETYLQMRHELKVPKKLKLTE